MNIGDTIRYTGGNTGFGYKTLPVGVLGEIVAMRKARHGLVYLVNFPKTSMGDYYLNSGEIEFIPDEAKSFSIH